MRSLGLSHSSIHPKTKLDLVIPLIGRRRYWQALSSQMDLQFPSLRRPSWLALLNCMLVAIVVSASFLGFAKPSVATGILTAVVLGLSSASCTIRPRPGRGLMDFHAQLSSPSVRDQALAATYLHAQGASGAPDLQYLSQVWW